jgi:hypothetical protein
MKAEGFSKTLKAGTGLRTTGFRWERFSGKNIFPDSDFFSPNH